MSSTPGPDAVISLRPVTNENLRDVLNLKVAPHQEQFVASNAVSLAQAHFNAAAWYRAIYADETPVGFIMLSDDPATPEYFLWRLLIDQRFQRRGYGQQAIALLMDYVKERPGVTELLVSHGQGDGSPAPFYAKLGFEYTGAALDDELIMRLPVQADPNAAQPRPLTHVVLFKLRHHSPEAVDALVQLLRSMEGQIPTLRRLEAGANVVASARAYDIGLVTYFDSLADMEAYQVHPLHQHVSAQLRAASEAIVAVDFERQ